MSCGWAWSSLRSLPAPALPGSGSAGVFSGPFPSPRRLDHPGLVVILRLTHSTAQLASPEPPLIRGFHVNRVALQIWSGNG